MLRTGVLFYIEYYFGFCSNTSLKLMLVMKMADSGWKIALMAAL
jgi:hypothetical protein